MIKINNLTKKYGKTTAVSIDDLTIGDYQVIGLVGNNGSGKTTLINLLGGRIKPTTGECLIDGKNTYTNMQCSNDIAIIDDKVRYIGKFKLESILKEYCYNIDAFNLPKARRLMKLFNLSEDKFYLALSKGMVNIFNLIIGLALPNKIILFDEITNGLDEFARRKFLQVMTEEIISNPRTYLISTHLFGEISSITEKVILMNNGKVELFDTTDNLSQYLIVLRGIKEQLAPIIDNAIVYEIRSFEPYEEVTIRNNLSRRERTYIAEKNIENKILSISETCAILANILPTNNRRENEEVL